MDKDLQDALNVLTLWIVGDVVGLVLKIITSILSTIFMPFLFVVALFQSPDAQ